MTDPNLAGVASDSLSRDALIAGEGNYLGKTVTLLSGQNVVRGAVLGQITSGGKYRLAASANGDGSQTPAVIVVHDIDASDGDKECLVYYADGVFNAAALVLGTGITVAAVEAALAPAGMHIVTSESAADPS